MFFVYFRIFGYDETQCEQPWTVELMFKILVSGPPVLFIIISLIFLHRYPITEKTREETVKKLKARRYAGYRNYNYYCSFLLNRKGQGVKDTPSNSDDFVIISDTNVTPLKYDSVANNSTL